MEPHITGVMGEWATIQLRSGTFNADAEIMICHGPLEMRKEGSDIRPTLLLRDGRWENMDDQVT